MARQPSPNGHNGRDEHGRFRKGNPGGPGNPQIRQVARWRSAFAAAVTEDDIRQIVEKLKAAALNAEPWAVKEILARCIGDVSALDIATRLDELEHRIGVSKR